MQYTGKLGDKLTVDDGYQSFRISALNGIAQLKSAVGELSRIKRIVRVEGSVQATPDFTEQPPGTERSVTPDQRGVRAERTSFEDDLHGSGHVSRLYDSGRVVGGGRGVVRKRQVPRWLRRTPSRPSTSASRRRS